MSLAHLCRRILSLSKLRGLPLQVVVEVERAVILD